MAGPINAYCDMVNSISQFSDLNIPPYKWIVIIERQTGTTFVFHDSELPTDVGACPEPGCYNKRAINYNATMRQIAVLAKLSIIFTKT